MVAESVKSLTDLLAGREALEYIEGQARFVGPKEVGVGTRTLRAGQIFINTGASAAIPDWPGLADVPYLTNTTMMELDVVPDHLVVAGASYVGLEFAQMYARFGARVTVIERAKRLAPREDEDISAAIRAILEADGVSFLVDSALRTTWSIAETGQLRTASPSMACSSILRSAASADRGRSTPVGSGCNDCHVSYGECCPRS